MTEWIIHSLSSISSLSQKKKTTQQPKPNYSLMHSQPHGFCGKWKRRKLEVIWGIIEQMVLPTNRRISFLYVFLMKYLFPTVRILFGLPWALPNSCCRKHLSRFDKHWAGGVLLREFWHQKGEGTKLSDLSTSLLKIFGSQWRVHSSCSINYCGELGVNLLH